MKKYQKTTTNDLVLDPDTNTLINTNIGGYTKIKKAREEKKRLEERFQALEDRIRELEVQIRELEERLLTLEIDRGIQIYGATDE